MSVPAGFQGVGLGALDEEGCGADLRWAAVDSVSQTVFAACPAFVVFAEYSDVALFSALIALDVVEGWHDMLG